MLYKSGFSDISPKISVLMSVYMESREYISLAVDSILSQSENDFEFLIVIDAPNNKEAISLLKEYEARDHRIKLIFNERNMGLVSSLNKALDQAKGHYIARMDADDIAEPNRFTEQLKYLNNQGLHLVGCSMRRISESGQVLDALSNQSYPPQIVMKLLRIDDYVPHPSWFSCRSVYEELNGYRSISLCEDYDFLLRALKKGFLIGIADVIGMNYRENSHGVSKSNALKQTLSSEYLRKNYSRVDDVTQDEINRYTQRFLTEKKNKKYAFASNNFNILIGEIKNGNSRASLKMFRLILENPFLFSNVRKIIQMRFIKKYYFVFGGKK